MNSRKHIIVVALMLIQSTMAFSQNKIERQTVYSFVKQKQTTEWYKAQAKLWKAEIDKNDKDANAWINYYTANRMLKIYNEGVTHLDMDTIVLDVKKAIPSTFEYHYIEVWNSGFRDPETYEFHIKEAMKLGPDRVELLDDLTNYYEMRRDYKNSENVAKKWFASNDISAGVYSWNYNMLQSVDDNAILFTFGDNDTYPAWVLQRAKGIKPNVSIINLALIAHDAYRKTYFEELGIPNIEIDWKKLGSYDSMQKVIVRHVKKNTQRPVFFGVSAPKTLFEEYKDDVHLVGLAYKWTAEKTDNIAVIKRNYEKHFVLDYLKNEFSNDISQGVIDDFSSNYILSFVTLYHHYKESEDPKAAELKALLLRIAERADCTQDVLKLL